MAREDLIYGTLGGYGGQAGEYGDTASPRSMTVYTGSRKIRPSNQDLEQRPMSEADAEFAAAEDSLMSPSLKANQDIDAINASRASEIAGEGLERVRSMLASSPDAGRIRMGGPMQVNQPILTPEQQQAEAGLARARDVLARGPAAVQPRQPMTVDQLRDIQRARRIDGDVGAMAMAAPPKPMTPEQEQAARGLETARAVLRSAPEPMGPEQALYIRRQQQKGQQYAEAIGEAQKRAVQEQEAMLAQSTPENRAQTMADKLRQGGLDFIMGLGANKVDTSRYLESQRAPKISGTELAKSRMTTGQQSFNEGDYGVAASDFADAYEASGNPAFLYNAALAMEKSGDLNAAIDLYQGYIDANPDDPDVRLAEEKINVLSGQLDASMNAQRPFTFNYAPGAGPSGRRAGVMAQDLEKSELGRAAVMNTPQGKMVDVGQLAGLNSAQIGRINRRVEKLEGKRNG